MEKQKNRKTDKHKEKETEGLTQVGASTNRRIKTNRKTHRNKELHRQRKNDILEKSDTDQTNMKR